MMIRAVIFDMDGLLIDTEKWLVKNWQVAGNQLGYPLTRDHALYVRSLTAELAKPYLQSQLGEGFDYDRVRSLRRELMEQDLVEHGIQAKKGAIELLQWLKANGYQTAVATATDEERAIRYLTQVDLLPYFDRIICATMVKHGKPAPDVYLYACECLGQAPANCLALEDSPNGVKSASAAGCTVVMVPDQTLPDEELTPLIFGVAQDLSKVINIIQTMEGIPC